jgi:hypothetical protein
MEAFTGMFFVWIWAGGAFIPREKVGFTSRVFWPVLLGARLARWAYAEGDRI